MRALIAFDKFKHALTADQACAIAAAALERAQPSWTSEQSPLADGGDGFCRALCQPVAAALRTATVADPLGRPVKARFGLADPRCLTAEAQSMLDLPAACRSLAIIELAQSSGLDLLAPEERTPWRTSTRGLGELMQAAIAAGADCLLIGLGGSATHDLGFGALQALGFRFLDRTGARWGDAPSPLRWDVLDAIERPSSSAAEGIPIRLACDVDNPLHGTRGAAAVFGPQKGMRPLELDELDSLTSRAAAILALACDTPIQLADTPGTGAAGGTAFGLMLGLNARLVPGAALVAAWTNLEGKLDRADLVLTGEGAFDSSSLEGKGPGHVARLALDRGKPVFVFAGSIGSVPPEMAAALSLVAISPPELPLAAALAATSENLAKAIAATFAGDLRRRPPPRLDPAW